MPHDLAREADPLDGAHLARWVAMDQTMTLGDLRARGVHLRADEAVAIAQQLLGGTAETRDDHPPYGLLSEETVAIDHDGRVYWCASAATPSAGEVGVFLHDLLEDSGSSMPGGLRYAIGRALREVEAPPFDSLDEFSATLRRFEKEPAAAVIARLHARSRRSTAIEKYVPTQYRGSERRRRMPSSTELRRQLRDSDKRLYEASRTMPRIPGGARGQRMGRGPFTAGIVACSAIIAGGLGYSGGLAHRRTANSAPAPHRTVNAERVSASPQMVEAITATPLMTTTLPLPAGRPLDRSWHSPVTARASVRSRPAAQRPSTSMSRDTRTAQSVPASSRPDRGDGDRTRAGSQEQRRDDSGVLLRLRFEWQNPFKRSH
jgi:hypothetical protein